MISDLIVLFCLSPMFNMRCLGCGNLTEECLHQFLFVEECGTLEYILRVMNNVSNLKQAVKSSVSQKNHRERLLYLLHTQAKRKSQF